MNTHLLCQFHRGSKGLICHRASDGVGPVYLDRHNTVDLNPWNDQRNICEVVHTVKKTGIRFVRVVKREADVFNDIQEALIAATWSQKNSRSAPQTEVTIAPYGIVKASWYESPTGRSSQRLSLEFQFEGLAVDFGYREPLVSLGAIRARVRRCVGPLYDEKAIWARQREQSPHGNYARA